MVQCVQVQNGVMQENQDIFKINGIQQVLSALSEQIIPYVKQGTIEYCVDDAGRCTENIRVYFELIDGRTVTLQTIPNGVSVIYIWNKVGCSRKTVLKLIKDTSTDIYNCVQAQKLLNMKEEQDSLLSFCYTYNFMNIYNELYLFKDMCSLFGDVESYKDWFYTIDYVIAILNKAYIVHKSYLTEIAKNSYDFKVVFRFKGLYFMVDIIYTEGIVESYVTYLESIDKGINTNVLLNVLGISDDLICLDKPVDYVIGNRIFIQPYITYKLKVVDNLLEYIAIIVSCVLKDVNKRSSDVYKGNIVHKNKRVFFDGILAYWEIKNKCLELQEWKASYKYLGTMFVVIDETMKTEQVALCNLIYREAKYQSNNTVFKLVHCVHKEEALVTSMDYLRLFMFSKYAEIYKEVQRKGMLTKQLLKVNPVDLENTIVDVLLKYMRYMTRKALMLFLYNNRDIVGIFFECIFLKNSSALLSTYFDALYVDFNDYRIIFCNSLYNMYRLSKGIDSKYSGSYNLEIHTLYKRDRLSNTTDMPMENSRLLSEYGTFLVDLKLLVQIEHSVANVVIKADEKGILQCISISKFLDTSNSVVNVAK